MGLPVTLFRLVSEPGEPGVYCGKENLELNGVALLTRGPEGLEPRPESELQSVFDAAYGTGSINASTRLPGLRAIGHALDAGDLCRATISSLLLKLPDIDEAGVDRLVAFDVARKANFNQDEPRRAGKWTTSGEANSNIVAAQLSWRHNLVLSPCLFRCRDHPLSDIPEARNEKSQGFFSPILP